MSRKPQVTITLGRSGQVVKRAGHISEGAHSDYVAFPGGKRPIRERLGSNSDGYGTHSSNKRQRRESYKWSPGHDDVNGDNEYMSNHRVGRGDLRFKLMHKSLSKQKNVDADIRREVDLRETLPRSTQMPLRFGARQHVPESKDSGFFRRIPPIRSADDLLHMDSRRKSYSSWTPNGLRRRSPDRLLGASRGFSPPRNFDGRRQVPPVRSLGPTRPTPFMTKSVIDPPRPAPFITKATVTVEAQKPAVRLPPSSGIQKSSYLVEEPTTVSSLLNSLGLGKYSILFQAEEVDMAALKQMGDNDLKELGIPMGPRKKILLAVMPRSKQRHT